MLCSSKVLDTIHHGLLTTKLRAFVFSQDALYEI